MLFYSEKREQILKENPALSMPEVAKICSEQYQKLSDKKKAKYKQRCDEMRRQYEEKLAAFYANYPGESIWRNFSLIKILILFWHFSVRLFYVHSVEIYEFLCHSDFTLVVLEIAILTVKKTLTLDF